MLDLLLDFLGTPAIILGLVAMIGLILQKKSVGQVFTGSLKTALGMLVLSAGAGLIVSEISPFADLFIQVFNLKGFATSSEAVVGAMQTTVPIIASTSALIMAIGFLVNIVLARFTPLKYIFLTGHMMWILSVTLAFSLYNAKFSETTIIIVGAILQGLVLTLLPAIAQPTIRRVTGNNNIAMGHLTTLGTITSAQIGGLLGDKSKSAEDIKLPESLDFFKDTSVSVSLVMMIFYLIVVFMAGPNAVAKYSGDQNFIVFGLVKAMGFAAGVLVLLQGVRMFLGELVPSFKGIADKLVPGAIPALDVPVLFGYAPNSLMVGFVMAVVGMIVGMIVSSFVFGVTPLISIIGAFFTGGVAGIMGNATGGRRGSIISGFIYGFLLIVLSGLLYTMFDFAAVGAGGVGHDCIDAMILLMLLKRPYIGIPIIVIIYIFVSYQEIRYRKSKETLSI